MSPAKFHDLEQRRREINGSRPSPLKLNKDSHIIHKSSSSSSSSNSSSSSGLAPVVALAKKQQPVIIYTHSPKVIHTQARDFMALVQKLTGLSRSHGETAPPQQAQRNDKNSSLERKNPMKPVGNEDNESSSVLTAEKCGVVGVRDHVNVCSSLVSPILNPPHPYFADIPLFTPNSANFFCSPRPAYRFPDYASNMGSSTSPSVFEFIKELPEY